MHGWLQYSMPNGIANHKPLTSKHRKAMKTKIALASFVCAIGFGVAGLLIPPMGVIDGSVLIFVAQLLTLTATFLGIENYVNLIRRKLV